MSVFPLMAAKLAGVPIRIAHNHSTAGNGEFKTIAKYLLRPYSKVFATHFFACSAYAGKWLFGKSCFDRGEVRVIPNAIDMGKYVFDPQKRQRIRKLFGLEGKFVVGHVGRFVYQKNHKFLIDIFNEIHKDNCNSVLLLIGEGPLTDEVQKKVDRLQLSDAVIFLGVRNDVQDILQAMDVFVFPSHYEGLGMVLIESQVSGLQSFASAGAVPFEAKISDQLEFIGLNQSAQNWAKEIMAKSESYQYNRLVLPYPMDVSKYNIFQAKSQLEDFYLTVLPK
jgi:glycosyltransferase involved in cell wall biosynthesis